MINVLIADDHDIFRYGLRRIISDWKEFSVICEATNGVDAYDQCKRYHPDIVLLDVQMPVMNGVDAAGKIYHDFPSIRIVMLTVSDDKNEVFQALKNGAQGYILKNTPIERLYTQLMSVMDDGLPLSSPIASKILAEFRKNKLDTPISHAIGYENLSPLSERETEVLKLVSTGLSDGAIAKQLTITELTVRKHVHNILQKLQLNNRVQAAVYAVRTGITS